jgi:hypothetical protein
VIKPAAVVATLLLFLAAGCDGHPASTIPVDGARSPLGNGGDPTTQCGPDPSGGLMTIGSTVLENHSHQTVTIERVSLYGDTHLRLVHAVVVPTRGTLIGAAYGWPPSHAALARTGVPWSERVPANGATIPPGSPPASQRELIIGITPTAHEGSATGTQVLYRAGGRQYELRTHTKNVLVIASSVGKC